MSLKIRFIHIMALLIICNNYSHAQSNSNQWENTIHNWENEIQSEENRLTRLENELREAQSRRDKLIQQGYTYEDENLLGDNALYSVDKEIYRITGDINYCKAKIESLRKQISEGREKARKLEIELEKKIKEAQLQAKQKKEAEEKAKKKAQKAANDAKRAQDAAERAEKQAKYEAEIRELEEKKKLAREEDERRRKARGEEAAAKAEVVGQTKSQNRMNNLMDRHEEHQYNIDRTNPYDMNFEQRQRLGGDYSKARMSSQSFRNHITGVQPQMSNMLDNIKQKNVRQENGSNLDQIEKELKDLLTLIP